MMTPHLSIQHPSKEASHDIGYSRSPSTTESITMYSWTV